MADSLVTLVFTDLVNSTAVKSQLPGADIAQRNQQYKDKILLPHRQRIQAQLQERGGRLVETEGDGCFLVFDNALQAIRWAVNLQESHSHDPIPTPLGSQQVKIGMHTGSPLGDGDGFIGQEVDYAARVAALASGGQVLLSSTTASLAGDARIQGLAFHLHGDRELKGLGRVPIYEVLYGGQGPRPLKEAVLSPTNLPPPPTSLVGRSVLLAELHELLQAGGVVVLKGPGGVGKTTLALATALEAHQDGELKAGAAWINCELEPDRDECLRQMADVFFDDRMEQESPEACRRRVESCLRTGEALVVLDNFESVAQDADLLRWLSTLRPPCRVVITTREVPPGLRGRVVEVGQLPREEAVALFVERLEEAGVANPESSLVQELCAQVGDLPLAIELLAARAARLPLGRLLERIKRDLAVLDSRGDPTRPDRHRSLRACFQVSYDHLSPEARDLLLRVSVLPDGAGPQLLTAVMESDDWDEAAEELVAASVWRLAEDRYTGHALTRHFALEQLGEGVREAQGRALQALARWVSTQPDPEELDCEWPNLVAAVWLAQDIQDWETVRRLVSLTWSFCQERGYAEDAEELHGLAVEACRRLGDPVGEATFWEHLESLHRRQGDLEGAREAGRQIRALRGLEKVIPERPLIND